MEYKYLNSSDPCQLTHIEYLDRQQSVSLQYDANGRMTIDEVRRSLNYDVMGRLKTVTKDQDTTYYGYDGLNRILIKQSNYDFREFYYLSDILTNGDAKLVFITVNIYY